MATSTDIRFSPDSLRLPEQLQRRIWDKVVNLVARKLQRENREVVTAEDVKSCLGTAVGLALAEMEKEGIIEPTRDAREFAR